jgi:hypothetical protein
MLKNLFYVINIVIIRVLESIVVSTCDYPVNEFTNPNPVYKSPIQVKILYYYHLQIINFNVVIITVLS